MQELYVHFEALRGVFPLTSLVAQDAKSLTISVENNVNGYQIGLMVYLAAQFPRQPPSLSLPYSRVEVPVVLPTEAPSIHRSSTATETFIRWDPARPNLVEAVQHGFRIAFMYWGKVTPPTVQMLTSALAKENPRTLQELLSNPIQLELYAHQHPMANAMRSASQDTLQEIESLVAENNSLRQSLDQQQSKVTGLQQQLRSRLAELGGLERNALFASLCTPEAIKQTLRSDLETLEERSRLLSRSVLDTPASSKRSFEDSLEQYRSTAKEIHLLQLKLSEYEKQVPSTVTNHG